MFVSETRSRSCLQPLSKREFHFSRGAFLFPFGHRLAGRRSKRVLLAAAVFTVQQGG